MTLEATLAEISGADAASAAEAQRRLDRKTKPRRSLGEIEALVCRIASIRGTARLDRPRPALVVAAGDHGVAAEGVSAYPQEVTRQMVANLVAGNAAVNVLAREFGAAFYLVDAGVAGPPTEGVRAFRLGPGTANLVAGPAMSRERALAGVEAGIVLAKQLAWDGFDLLAIGDMGIGNTTSASALCAALLPAEPAAVCGRGTGIDDATLARKIEVVARALATNAPAPADPLGVLAALGGFEIAGLVGVMLAGAARRIPVAVDGFIATSAALIAATLVPATRHALFAAHRSAEPGHTFALAHLGLEPYLDLGLRLGEGTGAALFIHLARAACRISGEMATFKSAGVDGPTGAA